MSRRRKYYALLEEDNVKRWYENIARGSRVTADVYLRRLGNFCNQNDMTPLNLLSRSEEEIYNLLLDTVSTMEERYAGSYIQSVVKAIKSWLAHNGVEVKRQIKIRGSEDTPSLIDERVPTQDELRKIFLSGDKKTRTASVLVAHTGVRIKTIGNYRGDDGLQVRDLPEMNVKGETVQFETIPTLIVVRRELSKAGHRYLTFLSEEGCDYLKDYLETRMREGEEITPKSAIVTPKQRMKPFIRATNVGDIIRSAIRKAGFIWRPYVLRSYFDTQLMLAESKGLVLRDYRGFWMGHKGDIENRYTTNKGRLPEKVIEDMRDAYGRSQRFLQTTVREETSEERLRDSFRKQLLLVAGFSSEEVEALDPSMDDEAFQEMVRKRLLGAMVNNGVSQRVIGVEEVERFLSGGWDFVATLPDNRIVVRLPN
ncbi:phage integrase family protein [Thaumarchaeota archaeon SCGC AB-539-E09]|nr:phage integrase family protein [Thaumarchaeota archaeon SCGC AB-539-E09]